MLKVGIVGAGIRGKLFADAVAHNGHCELAGFCDVSRKLLDDVTGRHSVNGYLNYDELLDQKPDIVCVTTPDNLHREFIEKAAARKIHVFCEKPMATTLEDCLAIKKAVDSSGIKFTVAFTNRWNPAFLRAKEAIDRGDLGDVIAMNSRLNDTIYVPTKMLSWAGKTSPVWFLFCHPLDLALWFSGKKVARVYAHGTKKVLVKMGMDTYDWVHTLVSFTDGTSAFFENGWVLPDSMPKLVDYKFEVVGDKGAVFVDTHDQMVHLAGPAKYEHPDTFYVNAHGQPFGHNLVCFDTFADCVLNNKPPVVSVDEGLEITRILLAVEESLRRGAPVAL